MQVLFYIFLALAVILFGYAVIRAIKLVKNPLQEVDYLKEVKILIYLGIGFTIAFSVMMLGSFGFIKTQIKPHEYVLAILGALLFGASLYTFILSFIVHYYSKGLPQKLDKWLYRAMLISIPCMMVFFFVMMDGYANHLVYPLFNGINFESGFTTPLSGKPNIAWYALCILAGALFVYFLCDHRMYVQYGKHGLLESTFLVAFPAGIIGARIVYVIGDWQKFANGNFLDVFKIWDGGITILGGAAFGIIVGVLWFIWRNKGYSIFVAIDMIVPTILLAQAIGRWGNFFNCEVHGLAVDADLFRWLPDIIFNNLRYSSEAPTLDPSQVYVPLFLIEGILNVGAFFLISELFGRKLRKYTELGDLGCAYIIAYGLIRAALEPLRYADYNMGEEGYWSWILSSCFIAAGSLLIVVNHVVRFYLKKRKGLVVPKANWRKNSMIATIVVALVALIFIVPGIILLATHQMPTRLTYTPAIGGFLILITGIGILFGTAIPLLYYVESTVKRA